MNVKELKEWLCQYKDEDEIRVYVEVDGVAVLSHPNMGFLLRDEIFGYQDQLDQIDYSDNAIFETFLLAEDVLDTLESRLEISSDFIEEINKIKMEDSVKIELPEKSFFDMVNDYVRAKKIGEIVTASNLLIHYVLSHIDDVKCEIYHNKLYICSVNNTSISTSIISKLLNIKASNIDDSKSVDGIWSIHLYKR